MTARPPGPPGTTYSSFRALPVDRGLWDRDIRCDACTEKLHDDDRAGKTQRRRPCWVCKAEQERNIEAHFQQHQTLRWKGICEEIDIVAGERYREPFRKRKLELDVILRDLDAQLEEVFQISKQAREYILGRHQRPTLSGNRNIRVARTNHRRDLFIPALPSYEYHGDVDGPAGVPW